MEVGFDAYLSKPFEFRDLALTGGARVRTAGRGAGALVSVIKASSGYVSAIVGI